MRRTDREVTDPVKIREIITSCDCCRLGFCDGERAYVVPLDFGFEERDGRYTFYFHGAKEGR
ncbi:pyridoxamine 5'-phosphate oxidase family protein, partial [Klebsiella oxytoca]